MHPTRRLGLVAALSTLPLVVSSLATAADTTVGDATAPNQSCGASFTFLQTSASPAPYFNTPAGVITSFRIPGPATASVRSFKVGRPAGGGAYTIVGTTAATAVAANGVLTQPTRIPTRAGDVLGVYVGGSSSSCARSTSAGDVVTYQPGDIGSGGTVSMYADAAFRLSVSAVVEPDADSDGYGDTTQDACTTQGATYGVCAFSVGSPVGKAKVGKTLTTAAVAIPASTTESFQWFRMTKKKHHAPKLTAIAGATSASYKLKGKDRGKKVFVRVTLTRPGFPSAVADSPAKKVH